MRTVKQHVGNRIGHMATPFFDMLQHIFKIVAQHGQTAQTDDGPRAFQGMCRAFGCGYVFHPCFASRHFFYILHQMARLIGRLLEKTFHQFLVSVLWHFQRHIIGGGNNWPPAALILCGQTDLQWHGAQLMHGLECGLLVHGVRRRAHMVQQTGGSGGIFEVAQIVHHQCRPALQKADCRMALCGHLRRQQKGIFQHMTAYPLQPRKSSQLHRLAHALHLFTVLVKRLNESRMVRLLGQQIIKIDRKLRLNVFNLACQSVNQVFEFQETAPLVKPVVFACSTSQTQRPKAPASTSKFKPSAVAT